MCTVRTTDADGKPFEGVSTYAADGKEYAFNENPTADQVQTVTQVDPYTITAEVQRLYQELKTSYEQTLVALVTALDFRDNETQGHSSRVVEYE